MKDDRDLDQRVRAVCSECGKKIILSDNTYNLRDYMYKIGLGKRTVFQCSYTCYHHADLRLTKSPTMQTKAQRVKEVESCERSMIGQGKKILHPINIK